MTPIAQHALVLTSAGRSLSATCFVPETVSRTALLVLPFAEERKGALPVFVELARALAERHTASLLFDFAGCGDSDGAFEQIGPDAFEADCACAWAWLGAAFPEAPRLILGLRTGALLAQRLAARHPEASALVLWSPVSGADFLRQLLQRRMVNDMVAYGKARESRAALEARLAGGETVDLDGYPVSGALHAWLQRLVPQPVAAATCVLSGGHDEKTAAACLPDGAEHARPALRYPPFWNTVGHVDLAPLIAATADWIAGQKAGAPQPAAAPVGHASPEERFVSFPSAQAVRAVFDPPSGAPRGGVLFLHGWSGDRTGPHRLFTRFGRRLAEQGWLCLRPDFVGRGLSDGAAADASIAGMTRDARAALAVLRSRLPTGAPVAIVAICSGCKVALSLAAQEPALDRLLLWSAESMGSLRSAATGLRKTLQALATYARKLSRPETWKKILRGHVQTGMVTKALTRHETRSAAEAAAEDQTLKRFRSFRAPLLFVFGGSDPDAPGSSQAYARFCTAHRIPHEIHTIPHAGHSYYGEAWTRDLFELSERFLSPIPRPRP